MSVIPKDPFICLSYINTQLRDYYCSLQELCKAMDLDQAALIQKMRTINYEYDKEKNQFK